MCFSLWWFAQVLVWIVVVVAALKIINILLAWLGVPLGTPVAQIIQIIVWAICAIIVIYLVFTILSCLLGGMPALFPHGR